MQSASINELYEVRVLLEQIIDITKISQSALRGLEKDIGRYMLNSLDKAKQKAAQKAIKELYKNKNKKAGWKQVSSILDNLRSAIGEDMAKLNEKSILQVETETYKEGIKEADMRLSFSVQDRRSLNLMHKQNMFWIGDHYNSYIHDKVEESFKQYVEEGLTNEQLGNLFETEFSGLVDSRKSYYTGLAEHITGRIRTFSNVKGYVKAGIKGLKISAILDGKTTCICREMNGRVFITERLDAYVDKAVSVTSEKELKKMLPMRAGNDTKGIKGNASGSIVIADQLPPYHWRCRTRTVAYFEEFETEEEKTMRKINNCELGKKEAKELQNMALRGDMKGAVKVKGKKLDSWKYHAEKHMKEFKVKNLEEYQKKVYNIIRKPSVARYGVDKYGEVKMFFEKDGFAVKTSPNNGEIYTAYKIDKQFHQKVLNELAKYGEVR